MKLKQKFNEKNLAYGTWSQFGSAEVLEVLGYSGQFDFTIIDTEHSYYGMETAENLVRAANASGISPLVRVHANEPNLIGKVLDMGADGVVVPQITTREEAEKVVQAARYFPRGNRGVCPFVRAGGHLATDWQDFADRSNDEILVMIMVEGAAGLANLAEIVKVEGIDAVMMGPMDLTVSLGIGGQLDHPKLKEHVSEAVRICDEQGVKFIMPVQKHDIGDSVEALQKWRALGCRYFTVGADKLFIANYIKHLHAAILEA